MQLLTVLQNVSQAADRWGRDRAETIIANHRARLFCSGIGDRATLDYLRHTLGEEEIARFSTHRQGALQPGSRTISSDFRSLAPAHRVRQSDPDVALLIYGRLAPAWLRLRLWYSHPTLRALAAGQPGPSHDPAPRPPSPAPALARLRLTPSGGPDEQAASYARPRAAALQAAVGGLRDGSGSHVDRCRSDPSRWQVACLCLARFSPPPSGLRPPRGLRSHSSPAPRRSAAVLGCVSHTTTTTLKEGST